VASAWRWAVGAGWWAEELWGAERLSLDVELLQRAQEARIPDELGGDAVVAVTPDLPVRDDDPRP
jgi:hypothetical protein